MKRWIAFCVLVGPFIALTTISIAYGLTVWHFEPIPMERLVSAGLASGIFGLFMFTLVWLLGDWD